MYVCIYRRNEWNSFTAQFEPLCNSETDIVGKPYNIRLDLQLIVTKFGIISLSDM
jgi:hypothetical protein